MRSGVFRNALSVIKNAISEAGGPSKLKPWRVQYKDSKRVWSSALEWDCVQAQVSSINSDDLVVTIDMYADGTTLARSGSQSACLVRMRICNL